MKAVRNLLLFTVVVVILSSCSMWNKVFKAKEGCPSNGRNVGAEKTMENLNKKQPKFKGTQSAAY